MSIYAREKELIVYIKDYYVYNDFKVNWVCRVMFSKGH
jgi:hypothetical protein